MAWRYLCMETVIGVRTRACGQKYRHLDLLPVTFPCLTDLWNVKAGQVPLAPSSRLVTFKEAAHLALQNDTIKLEHCDLNIASSPKRRRPARDSLLIYYRQEEKPKWERKQTLQAPNSAHLHILLLFRPCPFLFWAISLLPPTHPNKTPRRQTHANIQSAFSLLH